MKKKEKKNYAMRKSPALYVVMFILWTALAAFLWYCFVRSLIDVPFLPSVGEASVARKAISKVLLALNAVFISYFWLNGVKDFIYVVWYYIAKRALVRRHEEIIDVNAEESAAKVILAYCTCNDFDGNSLKKSMRQEWDNFETVILDDSDKPEYKRAIDEFAAENDVKVVRRADRKGFKAGNINNYLMSEEVKEAYDYVVILDSDEILPPNFIKESIKYFIKYENVGIVQANHISTRNRNFFMKLFHVGVNSHWPTYQTMKHFYGFSTMLGHGAMISRECYAAAGGFPDLVAEDLCLSIEARNKGYYVAFAPNIVCEEEYPIDYVAFKKRHSKWTQGNLEFIKRYTGKIIKSKMKWYEKADIVLFTYNLPLTAIFAFFIFMNLIFAPLLGIDLGAVYRAWMIAPTIVFFFSPMLNDFIVWSTKLNPLRNLLYFFCVIVLYGSMLTTSLISALLGMCGRKAKFIVTPKTAAKIGFWEALKFQRNEIIFSTLLLVIGLVMRDALSVVLIIATGYLSIFLLFFSNKKYDAEQTAAIDAKTSRISLETNKTYVYTRGKAKISPAETNEIPRIPEISPTAEAEELPLSEDGEVTVADDCAWG